MKASNRDVSTTAGVLAPIPASSALPTCSRQLSERSSSSSAPHACSPSTPRRWFPDRSAATSRPKPSSGGSASIPAPRSRSARAVARHTPLSSDAALAGTAASGVPAGAVCLYCHHSETAALSFPSAAAPPPAAASLWALHASAPPSRLKRGSCCSSRGPAADSAAAGLPSRLRSCKSGRELCGAQ
jgi:hypothetical protein